MIETQSWLNANEAFLDFLAERQKFYRLDGSDIYFKLSSDHAIFLSLYATRERARKQMRKYDSFRKMVY